MWNGMLNKLKQLKAIDRQCQAFGADSHRYHLRPPLSTTEIETIERNLGIALPTELRTFYSEVGDGIAGPHYGLTPASELTGYRPSEQYPGIEVIRQIAAAEGNPPNDTGYFEMSHEAITGLLTIIEVGCGHKVCLITSGKGVGHVVYVSADGHISQTEKTMIELYSEWLDDEIVRFETVRSLMAAGATIEQLQNEMIARFQDYSADDRMTSIADVPKPASLFGDGNGRIYHGKTQFPWYESVLKEWQKKNR